MGFGPWSASVPPPPLRAPSPAAGRRGRYAPVGSSLGPPPTFGGYPARFSSRRVWGRVRARASPSQPWGGGSGGGGGPPPGKHKGEGGGRECGGGGGAQ